jgi:NAD(P)-dependent dehydrogenase (short-subunit alcohol dehydrogenase family)
MSKTVIITGATGNLGTATVRKFLDEGYKIVAIGRSGSLPEFAASHDMEWNEADLTDEKSAAAMIKGIIAMKGKVDAVLMLVGGFAMGDIVTTDGEALRRMISLNFDTAYFVARPLFQHMLENGYGRLIFIGARPALKPEQGKGALAYSLSKSLLFELASLLNEEAKGKNVVASVLVPSTIDTAMNRKSMPDVDPSTWVKAEQVAEVLAFICSEKGDAVREPVYKLYNNS